MSINRLIIRYLGWCPGFENASRFFQGQDVVIPTGFGGRILFFTILVSIGIEQILSTYMQWFITIPQRDSYPAILLSPWRQFADLLLSISSLGLILLGIDTISTGAIKKRHRRELTTVLSLYGASTIIRNASFDVTLIIQGAFRLLEIIDIIPYIWGVGFLYISYRLFNDKPLITKVTFITASMMFGSELFRLLFQINQVFTDFGNDPVYIPHYLMHVIAVLSVFIFCLNGIRERWTSISLSNMGIPWYLKVGIIIYGISGFLWIGWGLLFDPSTLSEITQNKVLPVIVSSRVLNALALVVAAIYPWNNLREQV
jgi:hypothetical protein